MYPKTPSSSSSSQQHHSGVLRRRRHHEQESSSVSPPPNLIAIPADEASSPAFSSPFSSSSSPFSHTGSSPGLIKYDDDEEDYVYDTVTVKRTDGFIEATLLCACRSLRTVLLMPLLVAVCSILCFPGTTRLTNVNVLFSARQYRQNGHEESRRFHGHYARVVYLEHLNSGGERIIVEAIPSLMNTRNTSTTISRSRNSSSSSMEERVRLLATTRTTQKQRKGRRRLLKDDDDNDSLFPAESYYDRPGVAAPEFETRECKAQYQWQLDNLVTCNRIHEVDMTTSFRHDAQQPVDTDSNDIDVLSSSRSAMRHLGSGFWRDAWIFLDNDRNHNTKNEEQQQQLMHIVWKTMRYRHDYTAANLDRHRRDAMTAEHLTRSPHIVNIYAHCGNSGFFEYGNGGDLEQVLGMNVNDDDEDPPTLLERFRIAVQAASSLAALHNFDREGVSAIAHTDITLGQFISVNGTIKLNDFNRARFIAWNETSHEPCPYYILNNPGIMRSPEEYKYEPQTEKVDVYSFGNVLYVLLMLEWPFYDIDYEEEDGDDDDNSAFIGDQVMQGRRPSIPDDVWNSSNAIERALVMAIRMCFEPDPKKRASSRQVETYLVSQLEKIDPGRRLEPWGGASR